MIRPRLITYREIPHGMRQMIFDFMPGFVYKRSELFKKVEQDSYVNNPMELLLKDKICEFIDDPTLFKRIGLDEITLVETVKGEFFFELLFERDDAQHENLLKGLRD